MSTEDTTARRRGRRPAGQDTRAVLLEAARAVFAENGYERATVRSIAARAGVDAAMVNHWFGGKEGLFAQAVLKLPFEPAELVTVLGDGPVEELGVRIVHTFVTRWDGAGGDTFQALIRSIASHDAASTVLREFFSQFFTGLLSDLGGDRHELRVALCASQMVGIGLIRYVARFPPMVAAEVDTLIAAVAPTLQRYLTGDID
ncbi:TetR family transcriptional regulator [Amycolatopsis sp. WGS_07]|uniref:TetR/AcrR family transcriptional regulator n=1 Tax=Amycolatopsis sp. WGS_07 TaxID=3076764 RepID=UPI0038738070